MNTKKPAAKRTAKPKEMKYDFTITAVIPTEQYGNVQPGFTVKDVTPDQIEEAREYIHGVFDQYRKVREKVTVETETVVHVPEDEDPTTEEVKETVDKMENGDNQLPVFTPEELAEKSEPFKKAYAALHAAKGKEAQLAVIEQIKNSTRLTPEEQLELVW